MLYFIKLKGDRMLKIGLKIILLCVLSIVMLGACNSTSKVGSTGTVDESTDKQIDANAEDTKDKEAEYVLISQDEAKEIMDTQEGYIILDVRTPEEYAQGHIPNAICVPNATISDTESEELPDKNQLIMVYCRSGVRSSDASHKLVDLGYTNVKDIGGITTWNYDIEK